MCINVKSEEPYFVHSLHHTFLAPANNLRPRRMWLRFRDNTLLPHMIHQLPRNTSLVPQID